MREAMAMARMGALAADGVSLSLPAVTGVVALRRNQDRGYSRSVLAKLLACILQVRLRN